MDRMDMIVSTSMSNSTEELEAERQTRAIREVFSGTVWIPRHHLARLAGVDAATVDQWIGERKLFALRLDGRVYLPRYAFNAQWQPLDVVGQVIGVFGDSYSSMALAIWFENASSFLDDAKPRELVERDSALIIACAKDCFSNEHYAG
jgi:hypothetical protein